MRLSEILFLKFNYINNNIIIYPILQTKYRRRLYKSKEHNKVKIIYLNKIAKSIIKKYLLLSLKNHPLPPLISPPSPSCHGKKTISPLEVNKLYTFSNASPHMTPLHEGTPSVTKSIKKGPSVTRGKSPLHSVTKEPGHGNGYVFPVCWRNPNVVFRTVQIIRQRTGISDFSFHQLRHTVSSWIAARTSLFTAKTILGHADIRTTLKYTHPVTADERRGVAIIEADILDILPK